MMMKEQKRKEDNILTGFGGYERLGRERRKEGRNEPATQCDVEFD